MELNDFGFPNYLEMKEKFDLDNNPELYKYISFMYGKYNDLCKSVEGMSPEHIPTLKRIYSLLKYKYFSELLACSDEVLDNKILNLFENEPDKHATVQKIYQIYMTDCAERFKYEIKDLLTK